MQLYWSDQLKLGELKLKNRIIMAALTRQRCNPVDGVPSQLLVQYYSQRAGAGFILTEASAISKRGQAFPGAANIYTKQQVAGWKKVTQSVHEKDGKIFIQIFHAGRATHPSFNGNLEVWGPSPIAVRQRIRGGDLSYPVPTEMTAQDIKTLKAQFKQAFQNAKQAGFDGVQLHAAHGYILDSFIRSCSNQRTDIYGGSIQNRCRLTLEVVDLCLEHFKPWQIGLKISPVSRLRDMFDSDPRSTYSYLLEQLSQKGIGFIEIRESTQFYPGTNHYGVTQKEQIQDVCKQLRPHFKGLLVGNDSFNPQTGLQKIRTGSCDLISFGRLYISNPDLAQRILKGQQVSTDYKFDIFYGYQLGSKGYTDFPAHP